MRAAVVGRSSPMASSPSLLIGVHVGELGQLGKRLRTRVPQAQVGQIVGLQRELVLGVGLPAPIRMSCTGTRNSWRRLLRETRAQARDHWSALTLRSLSASATGMKPNYAGAAGEATTFSTAESARTISMNRELLPHRLKGCLVGLDRADHAAVSAAGRSPSNKIYR